PERGERHRHQPQRTPAGDPPGRRQAPRRPRPRRPRPRPQRRPRKAVPRRRDPAGPRRRPARRRRQRLGRPAPPHQDHRRNHREEEPVKMDILHRIGIKDGTPEKVYDALTTLDVLTGWWTEKTAGDTEPGGVI